jgi:hypothetical protein
VRHLRSLLFIPTSVLNCSDQYGRRKEHNQQTQMIQSFQMNNATVSDTEVSFAVSLYEKHAAVQRCCSFAIAGLADQKVQAIAPHAWTNGMRVKSDLQIGPGLLFPLEQTSRSS